MARVEVWEARRQGAASEGAGRAEVWEAEAMEVRVGAAREEAGKGSAAWVVEAGVTAAVGWVEAWAVVAVESQAEAERVALREADAVAETAEATEAAGLMAAGLEAAVAVERGGVEARVMAVRWAEMMAEVARVEAAVVPTEALVASRAEQ